MKAFRASALAAATLPILLLAAPAEAQVADDIVLDILRNCAQIDDPTARLACYDNNIRAAGGQPRNSVPGAMPAPRGGGGALVESGGATGFGREDIRGPERFQTPPGEVDEINARVTSVTERERGVYVIELEDGAVWMFAESVPFAYRPPRVGEPVEIDRASLGSFLMIYDRQAAVRVRRVR